MPKQGGGGGRGHPVLAGPGLGDQPGLAHAPGQQGLAHHVVELVRPGVGQVLALEQDPHPQPLRKPAALGDRGRAARRSRAGSRRARRGSPGRPRRRERPPRAPGRPARGTRGRTARRTPRSRPSADGLRPCARLDAGPALTRSSCQSKGRSARRPPTPARRRRRRRPRPPHRRRPAPLATKARSLPDPCAPARTRPRCDTSTPKGCRWAMASATLPAGGRPTR